MNERTNERTKLQFLVGSDETKHIWNNMHRGSVELKLIVGDYQHKMYNLVKSNLLNDQT